MDKTSPGGDGGDGGDVSARMRKLSLGGSPLVLIPPVTCSELRPEHPNHPHHGSSRGPTSEAKPNWFRLQKFRLHALTTDSFRQKSLLDSRQRLRSRIFRSALDPLDVHGRSSALPSVRSDREGSRTHPSLNVYPIQGRQVSCGMATRLLPTCRGTGGSGFAASELLPERCSFGSG